MVYGRRQAWTIVQGHGATAQPGTQASSNSPLCCPMLVLELPLQGTLWNDISQILLADVTRPVPLPMSCWVHSFILFSPQALVGWFQRSSWLLVSPSLLFPNFQSILHWGQNHLPKKLIWIMPLSYVRSFRAPRRPNPQIPGHSLWCFPPAWLTLLPLPSPHHAIPLPSTEAVSVSATGVPYPEALPTLLFLVGLPTPPLFCLMHSEDDFKSKSRFHLFSGILPEFPFWITCFCWRPLAHFTSPPPPLDCKLLICLTVCLQDTAHTEFLECGRNEWILPPWPHTSRLADFWGLKALDFVLLSMSTSGLFLFPSISTSISFHVYFPYTLKLSFLRLRYFSRVEGQSWAQSPAHSSSINWVNGATTSSTLFPTMQIAKKHILHTSGNFYLNAVAWFAHTQASSTCLPTHILGYPPMAWHLTTKQLCVIHRCVSFTLNFLFWILYKNVKRSPDSVPAKIETPSLACSLGLGLLILGWHLFSVFHYMKEVEGTFIWPSMCPITHSSTIPHVPGSGKFTDRQKQSSWPQLGQKTSMEQIITMHHNTHVVEVI